LNQKQEELCKPPDEYRLLLCDGHDSRVSAAFVGYCIQNRIDLILLSRHASNLLQLLDVAFFGPIKTAISSQSSRLLRTGISRLHKAEWLELFVVARGRVITKENILAGWRWMGLFSENYLHPISDINLSQTIHTSASISKLSTPFLVTCSPPNPATLRSTNQTFITQISTLKLRSYQKPHAPIE